MAVALGTLQLQPKVVDDINQKTRTFETLKKYVFQAPLTYYFQHACKICSGRPKTT